MELVFVAVLKSLLTAMELLRWTLVVYVVSGWFRTCDPCSTQNQFICFLRDKLGIVLNPFLYPIRQFVPPIACMDISPCIGFFVIYFVQDMILWMLL